MVGRRKLPDLSFNRIVNTLSIGVKFTVSFQWTNFGLKRLKWEQKQNVPDTYHHANNYYVIHS